jgi:hypothetical protein
MFIEMNAQTENEMQFICPIGLLGHPKTPSVEVVVQDLELMVIWSFFPIYRLVKQKARDAEVVLEFGFGSWKPMCRTIAKFWSLIASWTQAYISLRKIFFLAGFLILQSVFEWN